MVRNMRVPPRRSLLLLQQPSERESREFTKANTQQVQRRLAEVETQMQMQIRPMFFDEPRTVAVAARDSYTSLDGILSSYESSDEPPKELEWHGGTAVKVSAREKRGGRTLDIEIAFSSLGGFGSGGIWRKIAVLVRYISLEMSLCIYPLWMSEYPLIPPLTAAA